MNDKEFSLLRTMKGKQMEPRLLDMSSGESDLEVEVYVKVIFRICRWDGEVREHEADLPGHVQIKNLKDELRDELGDPERTDWLIERTNQVMSDDQVIHSNYDIRHEDRIKVTVHRTDNGFSEVIPVMEKKQT